MKVTIIPAKLQGSIKAIASKSAAHRLLICAALSDRPTDIVCEELSADIEATARSLSQLGAGICYDRNAGVFHVIPINDHAGGDGSGSSERRDDRSDGCVLDVGESGSTLRFLLPVICALGMDAHIAVHGRLAERPLSPLWEELERHGCRLIRNADGSVDTHGKLCGGEFCIAADISSQFVSGLLFALPLLKEPSRIRLIGPAESEGYIQMTIRALEQFGLRTEWDGDRLTVSAESGKRETDRGLNTRDKDCRTGYISPGAVRTEGDWSNGAFWEIAGILANGAEGTLVCTGLDEDSAQGDRAVRQLKTRIAEGNAVVDVRNIPDLVPVLAVLASVSPGFTSFTHAERLRLKESDRIRSTVGMIRALGGKAEETADGLIIYGIKELSGGCVDSCHDHRIAMSAAIASVVCKDNVVITGAEAIDKSYPAFWEDFQKLGGHILREP